MTAPTGSAWTTEPTPGDLQYQNRCHPQGSNTETFYFTTEIWVKGGEYSASRPHRPGGQLRGWRAGLRGVKPLAVDPGPIAKGKRLTAKWLDALRRLVLTVSLHQPPLEVATIAGTPTLRLAGSRPILARLLSVDSGVRGYSWAER